MIKIKVENLRKKVDGFTFITVEGRDFLCVESKRLEECLAYARENNIRNLRVDWFRGYNLGNLDFLLDTDFERLSISLERIENVEPLSQMPYLKGLYMGGAPIPQVVDLREKPLLELAVEWSAKLKGIETLNELRYLSIAGLKQKNKNLQGLGDFKQLEELRIVNGNLNSLEGVQSYSKLKSLTVAYVRALTELGSQDWEFNALDSLTISNCKKLSLNRLGKLPVLKRFELSDCGTIPSLKHLPEVMPQLKHLSFWGTKLEDGNLSFITRLEKLESIHFKDEKYYNANCKDLKKIMDEKGSFSGAFKELTAEPITNESFDLPTVEWRKQGFSKEQVEKVEEILNGFIANLNKAQTDKEKLKVFEFTVKSLDQLQLKNDHFIDTMCREDLVEFINEQAHDHGLDEFDDITWYWRKEW